MNYHTTKEIRAFRTGFLFILPSFLGFLFILIFPFISGFWLSLTDWAFFNEPEFVGLDNYIGFFKSAENLHALKTTILYALLSIPLLMSVSVLVAVLLNNKIQGVNVYRTIYFFPYLTSGVVVSIIFSNLFHPTRGPVNQFLDAIGILDLPGWHTDPNMALLTVVLVSVWKSFGYYTLIYLAGLQSIPNQLYEAARVEGASPWTTFKDITLPMLRPVTTFVFTLVVLQAFREFELIFIMTEGGPGRATMVLMMRIFQQSFINMEPGKASAGAYILLMLIMSIIVFRNRMDKKNSELF